MSTLRLRTLAALGLPEDTVAIAAMQKVQSFSDGMICRSMVCDLPTNIPIVVVNRAEHTVLSPINLAAALSVDCPARDVYLWEDQPSASLVSRARVAGIRGVIDCTQLQQLLAPIDDAASSRIQASSKAVTGTADAAGSLVRESKNTVENPNAGDSDQGAARDPARIIWELEAIELDEPKDLVSRNQGTANRVDNRSRYERTLAEQPMPDSRISSNGRTGIGEGADYRGVDSHRESVDHREIADSLRDVLGQVNQPSIIGVFSGRGGVGKSTVTLLLAVLAHKRGLRVALVDADLQFGDIAYLLGHSAKNSAEVRPLLQFDQRQAGLSTNTSLLVLAAPESVEQSELLADGLPRIVRQVAEYVDLVLINTSAFWTAGQAELARTCSKLLFLMDQRTTSIKACQQVVELCIKLQIPEARFSYAINGCHRYAPISTMDASFALGGVEVLGLEDGGNLVDEMLSLGCPEELIDSGNVFIDSLGGLLSHLLPQINGSRDRSVRQAPGSFALNAIKNLFKRGASDVA